MAPKVGYLLRDIDPSLWQQFKERAAKEGHQLRWVLLALLRSYVKHGLKNEVEV